MAFGLSGSSCLAAIVSDQGKQAELLHDPNRLSPVIDAAQIGVGSGLDGFPATPDVGVIGK